MRRTESRHAPALRGRHRDEADFVARFVDAFFVADFPAGAFFAADPFIAVFFVAVFFVAAFFVAAFFVADFFAAVERFFATAVFDVFSDSSNAPLAGAPSSPGFLIFSPLPCAMRSRLAFRFA